MQMLNETIQWSGVNILSVLNQNKTNLIHLFRFNSYEAIFDTYKGKWIRFLFEIALKLCIFTLI